MAYRGRAIGAVVVRGRVCVCQEKEEEENAF
jgi:hypothetical protein